MKNYILATIAIFSLLVGIAYLHFLYGSAFSGENASSDYFFSYGYVSLIVGCALAMSWGNISSFEEYQKSINEDKTFGLKMGAVFGVTAILLMVTAALV